VINKLKAAIIFHTTVKIHVKLSICCIK